jgi:hypothetical protein
MKKGRQGGSTRCAIRLEHTDNDWWRYNEGAEHQNAIRAAREELCAALDRLAIA